MGAGTKRIQCTQAWTWYSQVFTKLRHLSEGYSNHYNFPHKYGNLIQMQSVTVGRLSPILHQPCVCKLKIRISSQIDYFIWMCKIHQAAGGFVHLQRSGKWDFELSCYFTPQAFSAPWWQSLSLPEANSKVIQKCKAMQCLQTEDRELPTSSIVEFWRIRNTSRSRHDIRLWGQRQ